MEFVRWLKENLPQLPICLRIAQSRFVPSGVVADVIGIGKVLDHYVWKATGTLNGDWLETKEHLDELSGKLRDAVGDGNNSAALKVCDEILVWGGDRNPAVGACEFLEAKANTETLCEYIQETGRSFSLTTADVAQLSPPVVKMNSMLTKVHALYATDGLPIYDSRVAAAIASLVEFWRESTGKANTPLPTSLVFPATMKTRTVFRRFANARHHPGLMAYGAAAAADTARKWSSAKIRLGWTIEEVLKALPSLFSSCCSSPSIADRMHAFEASLFIMGYDVTCLGCKKNTAADKASQSKHFSSLNRQMTDDLANAGARDISTLSGNGTRIVYLGSLIDGYRVIWGASTFFLEPEFLRDLESHFAHRSRVPLGASVNGNVPADSLGNWLLDAGWPSRRYASAIAAILCHEGTASKIDGTGRGIFLKFR